MEISATRTATPMSLQTPAASVEKAADPAAQTSTLNSPPQEEQPASASSAKAFAYGALDLDKPGAASQQTDEAYTAGKWTGAIAKVGALVSLLI